MSRWRRWRGGLVVRRYETVQRNMLHPARDEVRIGNDGRKQVKLFDTWYTQLLHQQCTHSNSLSMHKMLLLTMKDFNTPNQP